MTTSKAPNLSPWTRFTIERESVGKIFGVFRAILATGGEASDSHILSIKGMSVPDSMPMLFRHNSTVEIPTLGRIVSPVKSGSESTAVLRVTGKFDLEGEDTDPLLAIRRGFASLVQQETLDAMSVRWDPVFGKFVPRTSLQKSHFAFAEPEGPNSFGMFFEESKAREGSIVAIGADPDALMGRARKSQSIFEEAYWTVLAGRIGRHEVLVEEIPKEQRLLFEALTKVVVEAVRTESREAFKLMREHEDDLGESLTVVEAEAEKLKTEKETSREVRVEEKKKTEVKIRKLDGAGLRQLIRETTEERVSRKLDEALGRITR